MGKPGFYSCQQTFYRMSKQIKKGKGNMKRVKNNQCRQDREEGYTAKPTQIKCSLESTYTIYCSNWLIRGRCACWRLIRRMKAGNLLRKTAGKARNRIRKSYIKQKRWMGDKTVSSPVKVKYCNNISIQRSVSKTTLIRINQSGDNRPALPKDKTGKKCLYFLQLWYYHKKRTFYLLVALSNQLAWVLLLLINV